MVVRVVAKKEKSILNGGSSKSPLAVLVVLFLVSILSVQTNTLRIQDISNLVRALNSIQEEGFLIQKVSKVPLVDKEVLLTAFSKKRQPPSSKKPEEIAKLYGLKQTSRSITCDPNSTTPIGWIPADPTVSQEEHDKLGIIPKFIFQSWKTNELKEKTCKNVLTWIHMNPAYDYFLFDDAAVDRFIHMKFGEAVHTAYSCVNVGAAKCDVWRLLVIYLYGGIYFDIDVKPKEPFGDWGFEDRNVITGKACNPKGNKCNAHQWALIYTPFHPVMKAAIEETLGNLAAREAEHVYDVSFWAFRNGWLAKGNQKYMPGWGDYMGGRVIFFDPAAKDEMMNDNGYWQDAKGKEAIWKPECLWTDDEKNETSSLWPDYSQL